MKIRIYKHTAKAVTLRATGDRAFFVVEAFRVLYKRDQKRDRVFQIPVNFKTDLGSVPRFLRWVVSVASGPVAFVAHDYIYRMRPPGISRREADAIMFALMKYSDAPKSPVQRRIAWIAVRVGGWAAWQKQSPGKTKNSPR